MIVNGRTIKGARQKKHLRLPPDESRPPPHEILRQKISPIWSKKFPNLINLMYHFFKSFEGITIFSLNHRYIFIRNYTYMYIYYSYLDRTKTSPSLIRQINICQIFRGTCPLSSETLSSLGNKTRFFS